jgi:tetratricopeptide (TPR) repeat protein
VRQPAGERQSLDAYEHYANGRQLLHEMKPGSMLQARQHFERALELDPKYALAYSGMGSTYALSSIQTNNAEDFDQALKYLERAIELDDELGEPYPFLSYVYGRKGEWQKAIAAGERAVKFQPDFSPGYYFYAAAFVISAERGQGNYQKAIDHLLQAIVLDPRMGGQWLMAAFVALLVGRYDAVERFATEVIRLERDPEAHYPFVGGPTMLGFACTCASAWEEAHRHHREAIESLGASEHVYRDLFTGLSACGLGEIELRTDRPGEALTHFRHAWRILKEKPRIHGGSRLGIRTQLGMAAAYAGLGERDRAEQHLAEASSRIGNVDSTSWTFALPLSQLHSAKASAQLRLGLIEEALDSLRRAIDTGFVDFHWFEIDPEWKTIRERAGYRQLAERLRTIPLVTIDLSRLPGSHPSTSTAGSALPL